jgi:hypothetical protein
MALAERAGLAALLREHVTVGGPCGVSAGLKLSCLVAGMAAGADSIDDMGVLRHGATGELFSGIRAPSTLGSFLRSFTWGNARWPAGSPRSWPGGHRCCPAVTRWRSSTWTPRRSADSAYYSAAVLGAIGAGGACFSVTVPADRKVRAAIAAISEDARAPVTCRPRCRSRRGHRAYRARRGCRRVGGRSGTFTSSLDCRDSARLSSVGSLPVTWMARAGVLRYRGSCHFLSQPERMTGTTDHWIAVRLVVRAAATAVRDHQAPGSPCCRRKRCQLASCPDRSYGSST